MDSAPPPLTVTVTVVDNGYLVESPEGCAVFEDTGTDRSLSDATMRMLYAVLEAVGQYGSKHDAYRVRVEVVEREE